MTDSTRDSRFREIFQRYYRATHEFFRRSGFASEDARDLTQETYLRLHQGMKTFRGEAAWSYVLQTARNVRNNKLRSLHTQKRKAPIEAVDDWNSLPNTSIFGESQRTPEEECLAQERRALLRSAIEDLPEPMRRALQLQVHGGLTYGQIALSMGTTVNTVKKLLYRSRKKLKQKIGPWAEQIPL